MLLAWSDPQLEAHCGSVALLRAAVKGQIDAAVDLLSVTAQTPRLRDLARFRSVRMQARTGKIALSIEEVALLARPLSQAGVPRTIAKEASILDYSASEALLIDDLQVHGRSIRQLWSRAGS